MTVDRGTRGLLLLLSGETRREKALSRKQGASADHHVERRSRYQLRRCHSKPSSGRCGNIVHPRARRPWFPLPRSQKSDWQLRSTYPRKGRELLRSASKSGGAENTLKALPARPDELRRHVAASPSAADPTQPMQSPCDQRQVGAV